MAIIPDSSKNKNIEFAIPAIPPLTPIALSITKSRYNFQVDAAMPDATELVILKTPKDIVTLFVETFADAERMQRV
jgi:hypothetical protein